MLIFCNIIISLGCWYYECHINSPYNNNYHNAKEKVSLLDTIAQMQDTFLKLLYLMRFLL